ncbi:ketopantoate reductase family protein [Endozoicomonas montiporae]|uniref:2-dehydropantoate 2-reductase n=1 Tax=Endozoicomonas montiporae CL-33 TaxID=570277 RepID=A0A142B8X8_9GAMM|nr:2-dehydropantoate 2-reductase [Endozoicomonas montiporae]AMO55204.1 ketopantoate reductase [Endozoicomonas montiporae CL-33]
MSSRTWYILGAGSIGCLWAANIHKAFGVPPVMIVRNREHYFDRESFDHKSSQKPLLTLTHLDKTESQHPVRIITADEITVPVHQLIVCTKAGDTLAALQSVSPVLARQCNILLLQNGMGSQQLISEAFPEQNVWVGSVTDGAWTKKPLHVCHAGQGVTAIGRFNQQPITSWLDQFHRFSLTVKVCDNIERLLWQKLAINCAINGLTALFDCQNGQLLEADKKPLMDELINEFILVSKVLGHPATESVHQKVYEVCRLTAANRSSTCMDARLQRKTELAYINGYLIKMATQQGLELPAHQQLMEKLSHKGIRW